MCPHIITSNFPIWSMCPTNYNFRLNTKLLFLWYISVGLCYIVLFITVIYILIFNRYVCETN
jgi:hypothetical protein